MSTTSTQACYSYLQTFLKQEMGYDLGAGKEYLAETRLNPVAAAFELSTWEQLVEELKKTSKPAIKEAICDAMTTNETSFFRDKKPFDQLIARCIPDVMEKNKMTKQLKIWCAACSSGQEPYTLAVILKDHFPELNNWNVNILATDISSSILNKANSGAYTQFEVQRGMPIQMLVKYFHQKADHWEINKDLKDLITFKKFNLMDSFAGIGGPFDIIFIRNVLIYFDGGTKAQIFQKLSQVIDPSGYMFLGGTETTLGFCDKFKRCQEGNHFFTLK